ncbi:MAG: carbohydrate-binding domain-containing protein [Lachnospiraceae bacterium]|nr:carbohydrate-binding domain-containing protein [Robinsoniella sp.]MDY3765734.1 carbohydrate-binding domain-containing protein [Lachnospiraceae bacterium]
MNRKEKAKTVMVWGMAAALVAGYCMSDIPNASVRSCVTEISQAGEKDLSEKYPAEWAEESATLISCSGDTASVDGDGASFQNGILLIEKAGVYVVSGELSDGQICVDADKEDEVQLVLNGAKLHCENQAVIYGKQCDRLIVTLADGTENQVSDGETYIFEGEEDEPNAAIFSKDDLIINGTGALEVEGNYGHGIRTKDDLILISGTISVTAVKDGIKGKDSVTAENPELTIVSGEDGLRSDNDKEEDKGTILLKDGTYTITAGQDGIQAETTLEILGGSYEITTGGGSESAASAQKQMEFGGKMQGERATRPDMGSMPGIGKMEIATSGDAQEMRKEKTQPEEMPSQPEKPVQPDEAAQTEETSDISKKGIKAGTNITISGGTFLLDTEDDAIHVNGSAEISDGKFEIFAGDDGCHADKDFVVSGGEIQIEKSYEGLEGSNVTISGGTISIVSSDDGINAAGGSDLGGAERFFGGFSAEEGVTYKLTISGGEVAVDAGGDGLDSNGTLEISGGIITVNSTGGADGAIDAERGAKMTGGVVLAAGSSSMATAFSEDSETPSVMIYFNEIQQAQTRISLVDEEGNVVCSFVPEEQYQNLVIGSDKIELGKTYTVMSGGSVEGVEAGFCEAGQLEGAQEVTSVTFDQNVKRISQDGTENSNFGGMMKGGFGRR